MGFVVARTFFFPAGVLLAAVVFVHLGALAEWLPAVVAIYPYTVLGVGLLVGWRFNRSRPVFALIVLALADRSLLHFGSRAGASPLLGRMAYNAVSVLLPLNLALFSVMKERGIATLRGIFRITLILLQPLAIALLCYYGHSGAFCYLHYSFVEADLLSRVPLSQPALLAFGAAFIVAVVRFLGRHGAIESA